MTALSGDHQFEGLHYRHIPGGGPTLLLLHSLSANSHVFDGLLKAGLDADFNLLIPDLPGRGDSSKTSIAYSQEAQSAALLRLLDHHGIAKAIVAGHSFGGFLGMFLAAHHPDRVERLVLLDSAPTLNPFTPAMVAALLDRLLQIYPSFDAYLLKVKMSPYLTFWDEAMLPYHRADVDELPGGVVSPKPKLPIILNLIAHLPPHNWRVIAARVRQPVLLVAATEPFIAGHRILPPDVVHASAGMMSNAEAVWVAGNHQTMLYGAGAEQIVAHIRKEAGLESAVRLSPEPVAVAA
jgi:pimeloyl-ACP methyl ester carboxylesterase